MKIAPRLALLISVGTGIVLVAVTASGLRVAQRMLEGELRAKAAHLATATAREIEVIKGAVEKVVAEVAVILETRPIPIEHLYQVLENTVRAHRELYGSAVALISAPGSGAEEAPAIPYVHRDDLSIARKDLAKDGYPYRTLDWYAIPAETGSAHWTEPYYDEGGGDSLMVTYTVPILAGPERRVVGLVTGDLSLDWLQDMLGSLDLGAGGQAFLLSRNGTVVSHPRVELIMRESIFSIAEALESEEIRSVGKAMVRGETGFVEFAGFGDESLQWLAYRAVEGPGWSLGAIFPRKQIAAKLFELGRTHIAFGGIGALLMIYVALAIARSISRPIRELDRATEVLARGNLDAPLPPARGGDEVARLTSSFARMQSELKKHIEDLKETTAAKARIEKDLETARKIQLDLLPSRFQFDPPRPEVGIHALLEPARAVGGDFYDFFLVDGGKLFCAVGDVSGKGVPAALFMAESRAYLRAFVKEGLDPGRALARLNDELAIENDEGMFLTVFCGTLDLATGVLRYSSGGHPPPWIRRRDGHVEAVPRVSGAIVGMESGRTFEEKTVTLDSGDLVVAYSDGVTEAEDAALTLYGEERPAGVLSRLAGADPAGALETLREDIGKFTAGAPQSDDITLLAILYKNEIMRE
jgi:sigma-B regulation protein RsbU (phosphoserine phosphatase)